MIQLKMPKDLGDIKSNLIGPFTGRQLVGVAGAAVSVYVVWTFLKPVIPMDVCLGICLLVAVPFLAIGWIPKSMLTGLTPEQYALMMLEYNVLRPVKRKYKTENMWEAPLRDMKAKEKKKRNAAIAKRSKKEKAAAKKFNESIKGVK